MNLQVSRHTNKLEPLIHFYTQILGLKILGEFKNHNNYDGVFLGLPELNWHLEFTVSNQKPEHTPDKDDLLVFYCQDETQFQELQETFLQNKIAPVQPQNPYWKMNGITYNDPDNYRIVIALRK